MAINFDFGVGTLKPVHHDGAEFVKLDDLATFLEGDRDKLLAATRETFFRDRLVSLPDGALALPLGDLAAWMAFVPNEGSIGADHVEAQAAWRAKACELARPATEKFLASVGVPLVTLDCGVSPEQWEAIHGLELAITANLHDAASPEERETLGVFECAQAVLTDRKRAGYMVAHVERVADAMRFLAREQITLAQIEPVLCSYPMVGFAAELLGRRKEVLQNRNSFAYELLARAELIPMTGVKRQTFRLSPEQFAAMVRHENAIAAALHSGPALRTSDDGHTLHLNEEDTNTAEHRAWVECYIGKLADALKYIVSEGLTKKRHAREMIKFTMAGSGYWMFRSRKEHLKDPDSTAFMVLVRAGFGPGAVEGDAIPF